MIPLVYVNNHKVHFLTINISFPILIHFLSLIQKIQNRVEKTCPAVQLEQIYLSLTIAIRNTTTEQPQLEQTQR